MDKLVIAECKKYPIDSDSLLAFISVETGGYGFDQKTGKILIQFEPVWFKKLAPNAPNGIWTTNKVSVQSKEWEAFNDAFSKNANAAMMAEDLDRYKNALYLSLNNTLGGAFCVDGKLIQGENQKAGEFGHMILVPEGKQCYSRK